MSDLYFFGSPDDTTSSHIGVDGEEVPWARRTRITHPYSYDPIIQWKRGSAKKATGTVYSDRLYQWNSNKYNVLRKKHFGDNAQMWYDADPVATEAFLRDYFENDALVLIRIIEYCNQTSGFPVWRFDYF